MTKEEFEDWIELAYPKIDLFGDYGGAFCKDQFDYNDNSISFHNWNPDIQKENNFTISFSDHNKLSETFIKEYGKPKLTLEEFLKGNTTTIPIINQQILVNLISKITDKVVKSGDNYITGNNTDDLVICEDKICNRYYFDNKPKHLSINCVYYYDLEDGRYSFIKIFIGLLKRALGEDLINEEEIINKIFY